MKKINKKILILSLTIITASIILLANLGHHIEPPIPLSVETNNGLSMDANKKNAIFDENTGGVVIDSGLTRIIFLNKDKQANAIQPLTVTSDSIIYYQDVKILNEQAYVLSYERYTKDGNIKNQKVTKYDLYGKKLQVIYEDNYNDDHLSFPKISRLGKESDDLYAIYYDKSACDIKVIDLLSSNHNCVSSFKFETKDDIVDSDYNKKSNTVGLITSVNDVFIYKDNKLMTKTKTYEEDICILDDGFYNFNNQDNSITNIDKIPFSPQLIIHTLLFWISLTFLLLFILIIIIKNRKKLNKLFIILLISIGGLGLSMYYSYTLAAFNIENHINILCVSSSNANTVIKNANDLNINNYEKYLKTKDFLTEHKQNNQNFGFNVDYTLLQHPDGNQNQGVIICSTTPFKRVNSFVNIYDNASNQFAINNIASQDNKVFVYADTLNTYIVSQHIIRNNEGAIVGSICTSTDIFLSLSSLIDSISKVFITLLIIVISLVLFFFEVSGIFASIRLKKKYISNKVKNPEIAFSRIFSFLTTFVTSFDSALVVLIAKDIITANGIENNTLLFGIAPTAIAVGVFIGKPIFNSLSKYLNIKPLVVVFSVLLGLSYIASFYYVMQSNIYGYIIALFASGIFTGFLTCVKFYMPLLSPNDDIRYEINNNNSLTGISGNVLSVALAGIVASAVGSEYIYIMALIPTFAIMLMGFFVFPKKVKYYKKSSKNNKSSVSEIIKFILTPAFLSFALLMLMTDTLATGYKSFIFPLLTDNAGFSKTEISNFVVISNFIAFLINRHSKSIVQKIDFLSISVLCTILTGLVFVSFIINDTILWATLVIAIIMVFAKLSGISNAMLWPRLCKKLNFPEQTCNKIILYFRDFSYMIRNMILSSLILMGISAACFWMGVYMIVGAIIFIIFAKKFGFAKSI